MAVIKYGDIARYSTPGIPRTIQKTDNTTLEVEIIGNYSRLESLILNKNPGDDASSLVSNRRGDMFTNYRIKTLSCTREAGEVGVIRASLVYATSTTAPYHITYTIDMVEVQRSLISHPLFRKNHKSLKYIQLWNDTPVASRVKFGDNPDRDKFFFADTESTIPVLHEITDAAAIKYFKAVTAGIENYNIYLPVISKVSLYLKEPPGATQDDQTHELSGTVDYSTNIGKWDDGFGFTLQGYRSNDEQGWFKSRDRYMQNADGTWQREEEWTFTNDKTHSWIYDEVE